nr:unnamed protein product [Rangifer tarandus platyrhynchus]
MTTEYDYGDTTPCQKVQERAFGAQLLPPLYSVVFVIGLIGNILVVLVLMQYKRLRSMTSIYLLNLAISDLIFLFTLPFWIDYKVKDDWVFGNAMCKLLSGFYFMGLYSEIFFIILLTIDRYLAIVHAVFALQARTVTFGIITSIVVWALAILASVPGFILSSIPDAISHKVFPSGCDYAELEWFLASVYQHNIIFLLSVGVILFCYVEILRTLFRSRSKRRHRTVRLIFTIVAAYFLSWAPYNLILFLQTLLKLGVIQSCEVSQQLDYALLICRNIAFSHCCFNPVLYVFVGVKFRRHLKSLLRRFWLCRQQAPSLPQSPHPPGAFTYEGISFY